MKKDSTRIRKASQVATKTVASTKPPVKPFPIVGFGASAGGLEAFSAVLANLDEDLGMAYVLVMHLSPSHKSALTEILQLKTTMPVTTVTNGMEVIKNNVYVIPPNTSMSIVDGHLKLASREVSANGNFAIDYFLTALASVYKNNSIGVILSGTATDGTLGLKAIKAEGGITFAQDDSAEFSGMPKSAYESGYADFILSPEGISRELADLAKIPYSVLSSDKVDEQHDQMDGDKEVLKKILLLVRTRTGLDFYTHYKQAGIYRRVVRRVALHKLISLSDYYAMLMHNVREVDELFNDFLINVTSFFRDTDFYEALKKEIIPSIVANRKSNDPIRIWVAGCATGEEAYSIAITLNEYLETHKQIIPYQIFASDLDANAIDKARNGIYPTSAMRDMSADRLVKFFKKIDGHYQVEKFIREVCIFSLQNLLKDPPFSRMDLISCQNVLIYLENDAQQKILHAFHYALKAAGYLFLGKSETIGNATPYFESLNKKLRLYSRRPNLPRGLTFVNENSNAIRARDIERLPLRRPVNDVEKEISQVILTTYVMPCVVINEQLNIVQFFGDTSKYLSPAIGKASLNILKMVREDLLIDVRTLIQQAKKTGRAEVKDGIVIDNKDSLLELAIEVALKRIEKEVFMLVVFKEKAQAIKSKAKVPKKTVTTEKQKEQTIIGLEEELHRSRELIRSTNEEYETTYEELQANNEQILSSNEELQSINEELEASKEELQSSNEELMTINDELQTRNVELKESHNYAKAIVNTVNSPFLVLTSNLQVRTANKSFYETFKLAPESTEGSFIYELGDHSWDIGILRESLNELLARKRNFIEFKLEHFFPRLGDMAFVVNAYRLVKEEHSKETLLLLAFNNIGDLIRSNHDLKDANAQLEQFIFVSSHDLQEPLRKIQSFAKYLTDYSKSDSYIKQYLEKIEKSSSRMSLLLRDLLSYSALLQKVAKSVEKTELNIIVKDVVTKLGKKIEEKGAKLEIGPLPVIIADPSQMAMLFANLLDNALKFCRETPLIKIYAEPVTSKQFAMFGLDKERTYACIKISDNGIGFNQKYLSKIFSIFQKLHDKPGTEGSGMGLAICKKIVEDHKGRIYAEAKENEGAIFSVFLPRV